MMYYYTIYSGPVQVRARRASSRRTPGLRRAPRAKVEFIKFILQ